MDPLFSVNCLTEAELDYELRIRGTRATRKTVQSKRLILQNLINKSKVDVLLLKDPDYDQKIEQTNLKSLVIELDSLVLVFSAPKEDTSYTAIISRLNSLYLRAQRFVVLDESDQEQKELSEFRDDIIASCLEIEAKLESKIVPKMENVLSVTQSTANKVVPVYKWGIQFDGKNSSVKAFLERVKELSVARNVSETDLFNSAIDLFSDQALIWFRAVKDKVSNWSELVSQMELAFLPPEYDERLLDEIKLRKQCRLEPISLFIASMQNLFNRLSEPLNASRQLSIIRKNILPKYVDHLALVEVKSISQLLSLCKKVDEASLIKDSYRSPQPNKLLESDLAYVELPGPSRSKHKDNTRSSSNKSRTRQFSNNSRNRDASIATVTCWNCKKSGHVYSECKQKRSKFCFRCGKPNFTSRTCPSCSPKN